MPRTKLKLPSKFNFATEVVVRVNDVNYAGHLSNDKVLSFIHEARVRHLNQFDFTELDIDGVGSIMTEAVIVYKGEAFHGDILKIEVATCDFHKYGCDYYYKLSNKATNKEIARAKTGIVFFDYEKRRMVKVPKKFITVCGQEIDSFS